MLARLAVSSRAEPEPPQNVSWVVVVTASPSRQHSLREELEEAGFAVEIAPTVSAAIACVAVMRPKFVVVDDHMEGVDSLLTALGGGPIESTILVPVSTFAGAEAVLAETMSLTGRGALEPS